VDSTHSLVGFQPAKWVPKWGNLGSQMGMAIANPTDRCETLSYFLGSQMGKSGFPNGDHWVLNWQNLGRTWGSVIANMTDRHEIVNCLFGYQMVKYGFPNAAAFVPK
jgi:hypothetical protein